MATLFANSGDTGQMLHCAMSNLGLHCLPVILFRVSRLKWVSANHNSSRHHFDYYFLSPSHRGGVGDILFLVRILSALASV